MKNLKAVLDTNVFISGIFWNGTPNEILKAWQAEKYDMAVSEEILEEYQRVSEAIAQKHPTVNLQPIIDLVAQQAKLFEPIRLPSQNMPRSR